MLATAHNVIQTIPACHVLDTCLRMFPPVPGLLTLI